MVLGILAKCRACAVADKLNKRLLHQLIPTFSEMMNPIPVGGQFSMLAVSWPLQYSCNLWYVNLATELIVHIVGMY